jgi:transposase-like protein
VSALGVTLSGEKVVLGFVRTATENEPVCTNFLRGLVERGLRFGHGLLVVLAGAKGLRKAVDKVFEKQAAVQSAAADHWHKRENVLSYLPAGLKPVFKRKMSAAYDKPTYTAAKAALQRMRAVRRGGWRTGRTKLNFVPTRRRRAWTRAWRRR